MRDRTADPLRAKQMLSHLSYTPSPFQLNFLVGLNRIELSTSPLSGVRSNQLSYRPMAIDNSFFSELSQFLLCFFYFTVNDNLCEH